MATTPASGKPVATVPARHRLTALETVAGSPYGLDPLAEPLPAPSGAGLRETLEDHLLAALRQSPCLVTFSGGRDSSTLLALSLDLARRHGLAEPVPVTHRFPDTPESDETDWQEMVVAHLSPPDWIRLEWTDELDLVGPYGGAVVRRHGQVMPFNAHFMAPMLERAAGGTLITGIGGDELFGPVDRRVLAGLLFGRRRPRRRELRTLAGELAPAGLRHRRAVERHPFHAFGWVRPEVRRLLAGEFARTYSMPLRWDRSIAHMWSTRYVQCSRATLTALSADYSARLAAPFFDPVVLAGVAGAAGARGLDKRESSLPALVGHLLPAELMRRSTKASFDPAFFGRHSRAFAESWDGTGVDPALVDPDALAQEWRSPRPNANTFSLLQQAWDESTRLGREPVASSPG